MKKIILSLVLLFGLVGVVSASSIYTVFVDQGIVVTPSEGERAYYPSVIFDGTNYFMVYDNETTEGNVGNYATSDDGVNWVLGGSISGVKDNNHSYHTVMLYDSDGFGGGGYNYKIWYLDRNAAVPHGADSIRYAESKNGINWVNDQAVFGGNMTIFGDDNVNAPAKTWGPGTVIYNSDATNIGDNPLDYSYVMYYDGYNGITDDLGWDNTEALFLAYSKDGINWNRYGTSPVLKGSLTGEWDATCVGYPTIMKLEDGSYVMWYSGGGACNEGIGFAISPDAINWTKDEENPMFYKTDLTDPEGYRAERTYTPRVIDDNSGELKMYYSAKSNVGIYAVGLAILELPIPRSAEIVSPEKGEEVSGLVLFDAVLYDDDTDDNIYWAVRKGTCAVGTNTVFGNVDGFHNNYTWTNNVFHAAADTTLWAPGEYCFIFNPTEGLGEENIRLTREFVLTDTIAPIVTIESPIEGSSVNGIVDIHGSIVEDYELSHYNISVYPGDADFMDFSLRIEGCTVFQSTGFNDELIYHWDTTKYDDGEYLIRLAARDKAGNRDFSGDAWVGGDDSQHVIRVTVDNITTKAEVLIESGVPGKGLENAIGLQKPFNPKSQAVEHAGKKK